MILPYLKHQLRAGNAHSIHSPFIYDLYTQAICPSAEDKSDFEAIASLRRQLLKNTDEIEILDLGAGSRRNRSNRRKISDIARNAEKPARFGELFYRLTRHFNPQTVLELGTSLGLTTAYFARAATDAHVTTMEGCPETARLASENFEKLGVGTIELVVGNIDHTLPAWLNAQQKTIDLVFFDANHRLEPTLRYFEDVLPYTDDASVLIFDDIYWSKEMTMAWEKIKAHPQVQVAVDLFWVGLIFFRKEQAKEQFRLRF
ncbi:O-methyltransferase [Salmonirosea aquatica]|uniref:SAM-dependent methyltransferase n=1 Tax=Salmonirosea aquatica TaxID=2654236 RepID=A0A7C9F8W7_9BACT|nr:SAM-dependent methyltransferase [Cytophagaceae bacterium SJW1-29]